MDFFIARQPIFDRKQRCYAYELLFRSNGLDNFFQHPDPSQASRKVIADSSLLVGLDSITGGKKAFLNVTRDVLLSDYVTTLPKEQSVIEIMETVGPDQQVLAACRELKRKGYTLALDDFVYDESYLPLMKIADIVKIDFLATSPEARAQIIRECRPLNLSFVAEKVETRQVFEEALELGYSLFQGYFFSQPVILRGKEVPGFKLHYLSLLREIYKPDLDFARLEVLIKHNVSLSYKMLRYVNSPAFGWRREINSIRDALLLLGQREVRKVLSLILLTSIGHDRPEQLVQDAVCRARFCESLAPYTGFAKRSEDLFLTGMFSLIDALIGRPMEEILGDLPIVDDVKAALLGEPNGIGRVLDFAIAYERGAWNQVAAGARELDLDEKTVPDLYVAAVSWAQQSYLDAPEPATKAS